MDIQSKSKKFLPLDIVAPIVFVLVFAVCMLYSHFEPHVEDVDMSYVMAHKDEPGFILLDVREEDIYEGRAPFANMKVPILEGVPGGHIPSAINFPLADLNVAAVSAALAKVGVTKDKTIVLYCNTGASSTRFADHLVRRFNFSPSKLKNYRGSIRDWTSRRRNILLPEDHDPPYFSERYINEHRINNKIIK